MEITIQLSKLFDRDIVPVSLKVWKLLGEKALIGTVL